MTKSNGNKLAQDSFVLKANKYTSDVTSWALEGRMRDAIIQEHSLSSPFVTSIHAFCGTAILAPLSSEGDICDYVEGVRDGGQEFSPLEKLKVAIHMASGVAAVHDIKKHPTTNYTAAFAHADLDVGQFVYYDGVFQLTDFNLGVFVTKRHKDSNIEACYESPANRPYLCQAPEFLAYLVNRGTIKNKTLRDLSRNKRVPFDHSLSDVFSLGTAIYLMVTI